MAWGLGKPFNSNEKIVETGKPDWRVAVKMGPMNGKFNWQQRINKCRP